MRPLLFLFLCGTSCLAQFGLRSPQFVGSLFSSSVSCDSVNDGSLISYWALDESSGDAIDSASSNDLTDVNSVTSAAGKINTARDFSAASSEHFTIADNAALSTGDIDFTIWAWTRYGGTLAGGQYPMVASKDGGAGQREWQLYENGDSQRFEFKVSNDGTATTAVTANSAGDPADNQWHFVVAWHDATANTLNIQVDGGTVDSVSYSSGAFDSTGPFQIGGLNGAFTWTGQIDEVGFTKRVLTSGERSALYQGGSGCKPTGL